MASVNWQVLAHGDVMVQAWYNASLKVTDLLVKNETSRHAHIVVMSGSQVIIDYLLPAGTQSGTVIPVVSADVYMQEMDGLICLHTDYYKASVDWPGKGSS